MSVASVQKEIERLQKKKAQKSKSLSSKSSKIAQLSRAVSSTSSISTATSKLKQVQTLEKGSAKLHGEIASIDADIAKKTEKLHKAQRDQQKKQEAEQSRMLKALQHAQASEEQRHRAALNEARIDPPHEDDDLEEYDAFISHASEDKEELVRPLADALVERGLKVWYDEFNLTVGDSLRRSIDKGLAKSRFGIVVLSSSFFAKNWTQYELDGLV